MSVIFAFLGFSIAAFGYAVNPTNFGLFALLFCGGALVTVGALTSLH